MKRLRLIEPIKLNYASMIKVQNVSWAKCNFFLLNRFGFFFLLNGDPTTLKFFMGL